MWIRSQDKKTLAKVSKIYINKVFKNVTIIGETEGDNALAVNLGEYDSLEAATRELDNIQNFIVANPKLVYEMK